MTPISRRDWLRLAGSSAFAALAPAAFAADSTKPASSLPPVRAITRGPGFHWFAYYDKFQFDPTDRYVLGQQVSFEHRLPEPNDVINVGMVDLHDHDRWIELGQSRAWCWQQGCMLQWRPGFDHEVLWNDRDGDRYVCRILDTKTRRLRTIPAPVYAVSPDGRTALSVDFGRIFWMRPGYGYNGVPDRHQHEPAPADSGIFSVDLETGKTELLMSLAQVAAGAGQPPDGTVFWHKFIHLLYSPDGKRFIALHRFRPTVPHEPTKPKGGFNTRLLTAAVDGTDIREVNGPPMTSHFIWRDPEHILAWANARGHDKSGMFVFRDEHQTRDITQIGTGQITRDGHCTYVPNADNQWMLSDTYPDKQGRQNPHLLHIPSNKVIPLGHFNSPREYRGEWRCDLHPRNSRNGRMVVIDSPHGGNGRQMYLIDISKIVG